MVRDEFTRSLQGDVVVIHAPCELDLANADQLRAFCTAGLDASGKCMVVDLTGTSFIDSTALAVFVALSKRARADGGWLRLVTAESSAVKKILKVTALDTRLGNYSSIEAAITG